MFFLKILLVTEKYGFFFFAMIIPNRPIGEENDQWGGGEVKFNKHHFIHTDPANCRASSSSSSRDYKFYLDNDIHQNLGWTNFYNIHRPKIPDQARNIVGRENWYRHTESSAINILTAWSVGSSMTIPVEFLSSSYFAVSNYYQCRQLSWMIIFFCWWSTPSDKN